MTTATITPIPTSHNLADMDRTMTPSPVEMATVVIDRIRGLVTLAESQIFLLFDADTEEFGALNAAIFCINDHLDVLDVMLHADAEPELDK